MKRSSTGGKSGMAVHPRPKRCYRAAMGKITTACALIALALVLAACGGGNPAPPTARTLALKLPGCHKPFTPSGGVSVQASTEQECLTPSAEVFVATFSSEALERQWIIAQQAGACESIQGNRWAADVLPTVNGTGCSVEAAIAKALGGRIVSA